MPGLDFNMFSLMKRLAPAFTLCLSVGCASVTYEKSDPKTGFTTRGSMRSIFSTSAIKGFSIAHETKSTSTGVQIKEGNTSPDAEMVKALFDGFSGLAGSITEGAIKGAKP